MATLDAVVVGAGPAGLAGAVYLGRFRRSVLVLDGGPSRASWIPTSHNTPGFPEGVGGDELLARLRDQALRYGAQIRRGRAEAFAPTVDGFDVRLDDGASMSARHLLIATGVVDHLPALEGVDAAIRRSLMRLCPICDAYEAIDRPIAVLGDGDLGAREARFLRTYSDRVTLLHLGDRDALSDLAALAEAGVEVIETSLAALRLEGDAVELTAPGGARRFAHLYLALGCDLQSGLARRAGARHDEQNNLVVDAHQETSISGVYAAGDVVRGLNQIAVGTGEAAIAATAIHNRLRERPREGP